MKAYLVRKRRDEFCATVVFAETAGKAKSIAMTTEACMDTDFCNIEVRRVPSIDRYYKEGKSELDWFNPQDRIVLVKELGFFCENIELDKCEHCSAKDYCYKYCDECLDWRDEE